MNTQVTLTVHFITEYEKAESPVNIRIQILMFQQLFLLQLLLNDLFLNILSILPC